MDGIRCSNRNIQTDQALSQFIPKESLIIQRFGSKVYTGKAWTSVCVIWITKGCRIAKSQQDNIRVPCAVDSNAIFSAANILFSFWLMHFNEKSGFPKCRIQRHYLKHSLIVWRLQSIRLLLWIGMGFLPLWKEEEQSVPEFGLFNKEWLSRLLYNKSPIYCTEDVCQPVGLLECGSSRQFVVAGRGHASYSFYLLCRTWWTGLDIIAV